MAGKGNKREQLALELAKESGLCVLGRGWPDFLLYNQDTNKATFLEIKSHKDKLSPEQREMHRILRRLGFIVRVVRIGGFLKIPAKLEEAIAEARRSVALPEPLTGETVELTFDMIQAGKSSRGGWNAKQLQLFDVFYPLSKGWIGRLIGKTVTKESHEEFLKLKDTHLSSNKA